MKKTLFILEILVFPVTLLFSQNLAEVEVTEEIVDSVIEYNEPGESVYWEAVLLFERGKEFWGKGRPLLEKAAALEYAPAMNLLASSYLNGQYGFPIQARTGIRLFISSAELGDGFAMVAAAEFYYNGWGVFRTRRKAQFWAEKALSEEAKFYELYPDEAFMTELEAEEVESLESYNLTVSEGPEDRIAQARNGAWAILGFLAQDSGDMDRAAECFLKASDFENNGQSGIPVAAVQAAIACALGQGVERDLPKANELLELSESMVRSRYSSITSQLFQGNEVDQYDLAYLRTEAEEELNQQQIEIKTSIGDMFADEDSVDFNPKETVKWYTLAAEQGSAGACEALGHLYLKTEYGIFSPYEARRWFKEGWEKHETVISGVNYAICLLNGLGGDEDPGTATEILNELEEKEFVAKLLVRGDGPEVPIKEKGAVVLNRRYADVREDADAQFAMGRRYQSGSGVERSIRKAEDYYLEAVKQGHPGAMTYLAIMMRTHPGELRKSEDYNSKKLLEQAHELGYPEATFQLGYTYALQGDDNSALIRAIRLYEEYLSLKPDAIGGLNNMANQLKRLLETNFFRNDPEGRANTIQRVISLYEKAADGGSQVAVANLGDLYLTGKYVEQDFKKALLYFEEAAENESARAHYQMGEMYRNGDGVNIDHEKAAFHYRQCLSTGFGQRDIIVPALTELVHYHQSGMVSQRNPDRFVFWLILLLAYDNDWAHVAYGDHLLETGQYHAAIRHFNHLRRNSSWADKAMLHGYAYARLGKCYEEGIGVAPNPEKAELFYSWAIHHRNPDGFLWAANKTLSQGDLTNGNRYLKLAAKRGSADANYQLADKLLQESSSRESIEEGMQYLRKAVELRHHEAILLMARTCLNEVEGAPDVHRAIQYASQASNLGINEAEKVLSALEDKLRSQRERTSGDPFEDRVG